MKLRHRCDTPGICVSLALAVAGPALVSGCSHYYSLGEAAPGQTSPADALTNLASPAASTPPRADAHVGAVLGPPDVTISGFPWGVRRGSLAAVGDLDGDGYGETALVEFQVTSNTTVIHLRYGGPRPLDDAQTQLLDDGGARLIFDGGDYEVSAFPAGDIDGDGYGDLIFAASDCDPTGTRNGAYLVYGGPERLEGTLPLESVAAHFSSSSSPDVGSTCPTFRYGASPGDIDGDGYEDLVIPNAPPSPYEGGVAPPGVYIFYGGPQRFAGTVPLVAADASFHTDQSVNAYRMGDIDGDGLADLLVAPETGWPPTAPGSFVIRGRSQRYTGQVDLASTTFLAGAYVDRESYSPGDLDGDGTSDVILMDEDQNRHLFYGAPGLFARGLDFADADATLGTAGNQRFIFPIGDLDGDGDDELLDQFYIGSDTPLERLSQDVALVSGSHQRLSGNVNFHEDSVSSQHPNGLFSDPDRLLDFALPAGDVDGDGIQDLFTVSVEFVFDNADPLSYTTNTPELHIHYGVPARATVSPIR